MTENKCDTCAHWHKWFDGSDIFPPLGDCMRMPPTAQSTITEIIAIKEGQRNQFYHRGIFPNTKDSDYCGEHELSDEAIMDKIKLEEAREKEEEISDEETLAKIMKDD